jgi:hypothetical protein
MGKPAELTWVDFGEGNDVEKVKNQQKDYKCRD